MPSQSTGVAVNDACVEAFQDLKLGKKHKFIVYRIEHNEEIVVDQTSTDADYDSFIGALPENDCRYAIYDLEFEHPDGGQRNKIIFIAWSPDTARIRSKMIYAGSKDALRRKLVGIAQEVQATDLSEVSYDSVLERVMRV
ncbi:cofilin [Allomyces javanicus]|nr:cofilin [Allomyces javanicus]